MVDLVRVVIDTQAVLDWQFFGNPVCRDWTPPGIQSGWRWIATTSMRDELAHVLARGFDPRWSTPAEQVLAFFDRHASLQTDPTAPTALTRGLRCTDPDDQKFVDLAATGAAWLVSRDRAVLKLRRRAFALTGLRIVSPMDWRPGALSPTSPTS